MQNQIIGRCEPRQAQDRDAHDAASSAKHVAWPPLWQVLLALMAAEISKAGGERARCTLAFAALTTLSAWGLLACDSEPKSSPPTVSTDLALLRKVTGLPSGLISARWLVRPLGSVASFLPGPTDTVLVAYLETAPDFWSAQGDLIPVENGSPPSLNVVDARLLLPAALLQESTLVDGAYRLKCERRSAARLGRVGNAGVGAARCGTALYVVFAGT